MLPAGVVPLCHSSHLGSIFNPRAGARPPVICLISITHFEALIQADGESAIPNKAPVCEGKVQYLRIFFRIQSGGSVLLCLPAIQP